MTNTERSGSRPSRGTKAQLIDEIGRLQRRIDALERDSAATGPVPDETASTLDALRESEARYRDIAENVGDLIQSVGPDGKFLFVNRAWRETLGYGEDEIDELSFAGIVRKDYLPHCEEIFRQLAEGRSFKNVEVVFKTKDGREVTVEGNIGSVVENGTMIHSRAVFRDITTRKEAERALAAAHAELEQRVGERTAELSRANRQLEEEIGQRQRAEEAIRDSEAKFRNLVEGSLQGMFVMAGDWRLLFANPAAARIFGYDSSDDIMAIESFEAVLAPNEVPRLARYRDGRLADCGAPADFEYEGRRKDGTAIWLHNISRVVEWNGAPAIQSTVIDVTERRRAEGALRASEERAAEARRQLFEAIESIPDGFVLFDRNERLTLCNRKYRELYPRIADLIVPGVTIEELTRVGAEQGAFLLPDGDVEEWVRNRLVQFRAGEGVFELRLNDGRWILASDRRTPDGAIVGTRTDVTERKRREEELRQAQKMEAVGRLTGGVAHDFNNLLTVILGNLELIDEIVAETPRARDLIRPAQRAARRGAELTQRLLAFSRRQTLRPTLVDMRALVLGMSDLLRRTLGESVKIRVVSTGQPWMSVADSGQIESALLNLALNARDAMPDGGTLTFETANAVLDDAAAAKHPDAAPGEYVVMSVADSGVGMASEILDRVFEPFFTTKEVGEGTGLGLSMVYGFVRQSGGHTRIESAPGSGTTVRLYLPRAPEDSVAADNAGHATKPPGGDETILLVEDDRSLRDLAVRMLESLGYAVLAAENGHAALALLDATAKVDALVTDVVLPEGMNGRELAEEATRRRPKIRVMYMSGYADSVLNRHGTLDRDTTLLKKPFARLELPRTLRAILERGEGGP